MKTARYVFVLLMLCTSSLLLAQEQEIRGKVTSAEDGSAIFGVNIQEKGYCKRDHYRFQWRVQADSKERRCTALCRTSVLRNEK